MTNTTDALTEGGVRLENLTKVFSSHDRQKETVAVNAINLYIEQGELVTLLGPSGCGKTTTLRMVSGFETPTSGDVYIGGRAVGNVPPNMRDISMVFQSYALFPHMTIFDNVAYGLKVRKLSKNERLLRTNKTIRLMQLESMENRYPNQLSGGQQQRVALARAVAIEPKVLLFDEPLSNLDAKLREHMRDELRMLQKRLGITSLYVTHDQTEAMAISDKVVIMKDGIIRQTGSPKEIYKYPADRFIANFIGKMNFIECTLKGVEDGCAVVALGEVTYRVPDPGAMQGIEAGATCALSARPEAIHLSSKEGVFKATVSQVTYYGAHLEYKLAYCDQEITVEVANPPMSEEFAAGDEVYVSLDAPCVRVLK